jgi:hypothetical protein
LEISEALEEVSKWKSFFLSDYRNLISMWPAH